jgi:hypothetical protein
MATDLFGNTENSSTLSRSPFFSRFTQFENTNSNYALIAFTPGLALQAAELNELQDNFHKVFTLNNIMISNWTLEVMKNISNVNTLNGVLWTGTVPLNPNQISIGGGRITFGEGWYYYNHKSNLQYWIYLDSDQTFDASSLSNTYIGFNVNLVDVYSNTDSRLNDNSSGSVNSNSPGSYRVSFLFDSIQASNSLTTYSPMIEKRAGNYYFLNGLQLQ